MVFFLSPEPSFSKKWRLGRGFLVNFFWSLCPGKQSTKNPRKNRGKFRKTREKIRDENSKNLGKLSFCNFSDLKVGVVSAPALYRNPAVTWASNVLL